jgi:hypothetical protein
MKFFFFLIAQFQKRKKLLVTAIIHRIMNLRLTLSHLIGFDSMHRHGRWFQMLSFWTMKVKNRQKLALELERACEL